MSLRSQRLLPLPLTIQPGTVQNPSRQSITSIIITIKAKLVASSLDPDLRRRGPAHFKLKAAPFVDENPRTVAFFLFVDLSI